MKVYLINPPAPKNVKMVREGRCMQRKGAWGAVWPQISLALIGAQLKADHHEVTMSDCITGGIHFPALSALIADFKPDLIIINTATPSIISDLYTAQAAKEAYPSVQTSVIGIHVTALPDECFELQPSLDVIIREEPEMTAAELARFLAAEKNLDGVRGISFRTADAIRHNPSRKPLENIDTLPFPAWDLIDRSKHIMPFTNREFLLIATSRGCPYPCTFCADATYYGKKLRCLSPARIVDEMVWNQDHYGVSDFLFWAEGFTLNKNISHAVVDEILTRGIKTQWVCNSRVDNVEADLLKKFKQAGCWMIGYGIESGNDDILKAIKKNTTVRQIRDAVRWAQEAGLMTTGHFVIGLPGETKEHVNRTIDLSIELDLDFAQFYCAAPFPGSALYRTAKEQGWICSDDWALFEQNFSVLNTPQLTADETMKLRRKAYRKFYFNVHQIIKTARRIRSFELLKLFVGMVKEFFTWI